MKVASLVLIAVLSAAGGCSGQRDIAAEEPAVPVVSGQYAATFDAARHTLREQGFILERVDAQAGVITTQAKTTAGLFTPWDREQQNITQEGEDLFERHQRVVRVTFDRAGAANPPESDAPPLDLRAISEPLNMRIAVILQRTNIPGHRLEPEAVWLSSYCSNPELAAREMEPQYAVAIRQDEALARHLADLIVAAAGSH